MIQILIFGDSITYGLLDRLGGWVQRLRRHVDTVFLKGDLSSIVLCYNLGVSGDAVDNILDRFDREVKSRAWASKIIVIFQLGMNDSEMNYVDGGARCLEKEFKKKARVLIRKAKRITKLVVVLGPTPIDEDRTNPIPWAPTKILRNERIERFNLNLANVCGEEKILFIDIYSKFWSGNYKRLTQDGVHLNSNGHRLVYEIVKDFLISRKILTT